MLYKNDKSNNFLNENRKYLTGFFVTRVNRKLSTCLTSSPVQTHGCHIICEIKTQLHFPIYLSWVQERTKYKKDSSVMAHSETILYNPVYHFHIKQDHHKQYLKVYFTLSEIRNPPIPRQYITYKVPGRLFAQQLTAESTHRLVNSSPMNSALLISESTDSHHQHPRATILNTPNGIVPSWALFWHGFVITT